MRSIAPCLALLSLLTCVGALPAQKGIAPPVRPPVIPPRPVVPPVIIGPKTNIGSPLNPVGKGPIVAGAAQPKPKSRAVVIPGSEIGGTAAAAVSQIALLGSALGQGPLLTSATLPARKEAARFHGTGATAVSTKAASNVLLSGSVPGPLLAASALAVQRSDWLRQRVPVAAQPAVANPPFIPPGNVAPPRPALAGHGIFPTVLIIVPIAVLVIGLMIVIARTATGARRRVRIIDMPEGEAPDHIRRAWIGLELPLARGERGPRRQQAHGVLTGEDGPAEGYVVDAGEALSVLESSNPQAAQWWRVHAPHVTARGYQFIFSAEVCERTLT